MSMNLNVRPWKILKPGISLRRPGVSWFNAVTRFLTTFEVAPSADGDFRVDRPNADGSQAVIRIPLGDPVPGPGDDGMTLVSDNGLWTVDYLPLVDIPDP